MLSGFISVLGGIVVLLDALLRDSWANVGAATVMCVYGLILARVAGNYYTHLVRDEHDGLDREINTNNPL